MNLKVNEVIEQEDGSAILNIDMDDEMKVFLINHAFIDILKRAIGEFKKEMGNE